MNRRRFLQMLGLGALVPAALSLPPLPQSREASITIALDTSEIDAALRQIWDGFIISPTEMYVGDEALEHIRGFAVTPEHPNCRCTLVDMDYARAEEKVLALEAGDMIHEGGNVYRLKLHARV